MYDHYIFVCTWHDDRHTGDTRAFSSYSGALAYKREIAFDLEPSLSLDSTTEQISDWWDRQFPDYEFNIDEIPLEE